MAEQKSPTQERLAQIKRQRRDFLAKHAPEFYRAVVLAPRAQGLPVEIALFDAKVMWADIYREDAAELERLEAEAKAKAATTTAGDGG